ncbi:phage tail tip fiber protein, partial [Pseudomonas aeruginosa]
LITKEYVESALGEQFFENIEQIGGNVDQLMEQYYDAGTVYQKGQIVRLNGRFYQALKDVPAGNPPPNPVYWADVGELVESVDALALRVTENAAAIEELDGVVQSSASSLDVLQAAARREPATGEKADALKGWDTIARAATEVIVRANEIEAQAKRVETVQAQTSANGAAIQTTQSVVASLDQGVKAMYSVKLQASANGQQYATGFQLGFDSGTSVTTMAFQADRFLWFNSSSGQTVAPVSIVGGQMFINNAMIQDGSITNAKIGNVIQSTALGANGEPLWKLDKAGSLTMNSATSGGFMRQTAEAVKVYDANLVLRVQIGNLDA